MQTTTLQNQDNERSELLICCLNLGGAGRNGIHGLHDAQLLLFRLIHGFLIWISGDEPIATRMLRNPIWRIFLDFFRVLHCEVQGIGAPEAYGHPVWNAGLAASLKAAPIGLKWRRRQQANYERSASIWLSQQTLIKELAAAACL